MFNWEGLVCFGRLSPKSIIQDQLAEATSLGLKAVTLGNCHLDDISSRKYQIIYSSAVKALPFLTKEDRFTLSPASLCDCG